MDLDLRIAALAKLASSDTEEARKRLVKELAQIEQTLREESDFETLFAALKTLRVIAHKVPIPAITALEEFTKSLSDRTITHGDEPMSQYLKKYRTASVLTKEAIEVAGVIRYIETESVLSYFLRLSQSPDDDIRDKTGQALQELAEFDLGVFYGDDIRHGLGAQPQERIVAYFSSLTNDELAAKSGAILRTLSGALSPSMQGTSWTYNTVTFSRGATPPLEDVARMREGAIRLLKRMYPLEPSVAYRKSVLRTLYAATRRETMGEMEPQATQMFARDAIAVLAFFKSLVPSEALPLVQQIEHDSYWAFFHALTVEVSTSALEVQVEIAKHHEYDLYKTLIGFDGIFGNWEELKGSDAAWDDTDSKRRARAEQFVEQITSDVFEEWRERILRFSKTESDDLATFPIFHHFLQTLATRRQTFAFTLLRDDAEALAPFLIPLVRGLWAGELAADVEPVVERWIRNGKYLTQVAKSLYGSGSRRLHILSLVVSKAIDTNDTWSMTVAMGVAAALHSEGVVEAMPVFMAVLREMTKRGDARWARDIWHSREFRRLVRDLDPSDRSDLLKGLRPLDAIDYRAEEILFSIAQFDPKIVLEYLLDRLQHEREGREGRSHSAVDSPENRYEAIPYQLHKLHEPLSKVPDDVLRSLRKDFEAEDAAMFTYRGARLVKAIFPEFGEELETRLMRMVESGDPNDISFVIAVLRTYDGSPAIQQTCKAVIKAVPERSKVWSEVAAAIETTGVVMGEYGIAQAYERKQTEITPWKEDADPRVRAFANWLIDGLNQMIDRERKRTDEEVMLRKYRYGTGKQE